MIVVRLFFCLSFLLGLFSPAFAEQEPPYKVAAILPLSGDYASLGNYLKNGIDLAYEQLSPEQKKKIEISYEVQSLF